ncbi:MAG TPA: alpha-amylase family glycosyl hydrolase [Acidimicrobiales bacterium]
MPTDPSTPPWWATAVVYQVYPRSFADTDGDGVGDLRGILQRLDHLERLGVDAVWLSPFYRSPMKDFGYDVSDHCDVDPLFGTLADLDALVTDAHRRGIRVIVDFVPNHTSDLHPWFQDSRSSRESEHRDWYVWRDPAPDGGPPNNWLAAFGGRAWTLDEASGQYYLHQFLPEQPDLDWSSPGVVAAMHEVVRFWLDRGVDGLRVDVAHGLGKDPLLGDDPASTHPTPHAELNDRVETHEHLRGLRRLIDSYPGERVMVGEVYLLDTRLVAPYYGRDDELHLAFNFPPLYTAWDAQDWAVQIRTTTALLEPLDAWPTWVLSNHDNPRHRTRYDGSETRARAATLLLLGLRGTPFLYAGEELGLLDAEVAPDRVVDPGGRDGCRAPIPWDATVRHGWPADPWLPFPPESDTHDVAGEWADPGSTLNLYQRSLRVRYSSPALSRGDQRLLDAPVGVLAWERTSEADRVVVLVNFTDRRVELAGTEAGDAADAAQVLVASDGIGEGEALGGHLGPDQALWVRRG